jgi:hypothetical protein
MKPRYTFTTFTMPDYISAPAVLFLFIFVVYTIVTRGENLRGFRLPSLYQIGEFGVELLCEIARPVIVLVALLLLISPLILVTYLLHHAGWKQL